MNADMANRDILRIKRYSTFIVTRYRKSRATYIFHFLLPKYKNYDLH